MKINLKYLFIFFITFSAFKVYAGPLDDFVTTWKTDNPGTSNNTSITIPTHSGTTYNYDVDWNNDGIFDEFGITGNVTHDYGTAGTYTIRIQGQFPRIYFLGSGDREKILSVNQWGTQVWTSMEKAFYYCTNLNGPTSDNPDLTNVLDMSYMFYKAILFNQPIGNWNTSNVTNMQSVFSYASSFNQYIGNWNTSNVTNMSTMFNATNYFNQYIGNWNTSNVTNMGGMFFNAVSFNQYIGNWNTGNVINMQSLFLNANSFNQNISAWNTSNVTHMGGMFRIAFSFNQNIGNWNTSNVANMSGMFYNSTSFNQDLSNWDIGNLTNATNMFRNITLSTSNYDSLLIGWQGQIHNNNIPFHGGNSKYCAAENARNILIGTDGWSISDGGSIAIVDVLQLQTNCDTLTLPFLTNGNYYTQPNGIGLALFAGDKIFSNQTLYIFADNGTCTKESSFQIIITSSNDTISQTSCNPSDTGIITQTLTNQYGCDSIITVITDLLITSTYDTLNLSSCNPIDTGVVTQNLINQNFCDSIVTTITSLLHSSNDTINATSCNPADTGIFVQNLTNQNGCDSIVTTFTSLLPSSNDTSILSSCNPNDTGTLIQTYTNQFGCDSIITTITSSLPSFSTEVNDSICSSEEYLLPDGTSINSSGTYIDTFSANTSCDSIHTVNLFVSKEYFNEETVHICSGDSFVFPDGSVRRNIDYFIIYNSYLQTKANCDSIIKTNVNVTSIIKSISKDRNKLTSDMADASYQWINCDNNQMIAGETERDFTPSENGNYAVNITRNGCFDTSDCIVVNKICSLGDNIVIYPNPATDILFISCDNILSSVIFDMQGKNILSTNKNEIDIQNLSSGIYYIQMFNSDNEIIGIKKFIKSK